MIGILLALQVNNWNENKTLTKKTNTFLLNLKSDLENDYDQIDNVINIQSERFLFIDSILGSPEHKHDSSSKILITGRNETFFPLAGIYKSASEEGLLNNIKNEKLRFAIINLYEHYYVRLQYNGELNDQRHENVEWNSRNYINHNVLGFNFSLNALGDPDFLHQLTYLNKFTRIYSDRAKSIKAIMQTIIEMIEIELGEEQGSN